MKRPARAIMYSFFIVLLLVVTFVFPKQAPEAHAQGATLTNPLLTGPVDPYVIYLNGYYYYTGTTATNIQVWRSATIAGLASATPVTVWTPTAGTPDCCDLWAPEIHYINNTWYIYYAAYIDHNNYVVAFLDRQYGVYATYAVVGGTAQSWQNANLPAGFNPALYHTIKVVKAGSTFTFYLDGTQMQQRTFNLLEGQPGLVTEDTAANYRNFSVSNVN